MTSRLWIPNGESNSRKSGCIIPNLRASSGRPYLYDASLTSIRGDSACASCHVFGDFDGLAWDLGDPDNRRSQQRRVHRPSHPGRVSRQPPFPPHEGTDDDTESARPRQSRCHALARRPPGQFSAQRPTCVGSVRRKRRVQQVQCRFEVDGRSPPVDIRTDEASTDFALQSPIHPIRSGGSRQRAHGGSTGRKEFLLRRRFRHVLQLQRVSHPQSRRQCRVRCRAAGILRTDGKFSSKQNRRFSRPRTAQHASKVGMFGMPRRRFSYLNPPVALTTPSGGIKSAASAFCMTGRSIREPFPLL